MTNPPIVNLVNEESVKSFFDQYPDEVLEKVTFRMPWQYDVDEGTYGDPDDFVSPKGTDPNKTRDVLQEECWNKFHRNPQMNTSVRDQIGSIVGWGFEVTSEIPEIQEVIEEIELDPRNRLYNFLPKYLGRYNIEGEWFTCLTCHDDGFIEIDFIDPSTVKDGGTEDSGVFFHPNKTSMPLFYNIKDEKRGEFVQYPSIFIARYPELTEIALKMQGCDAKYQQKCKSRKRIFNKFGGYFRFIVAWDNGFMTRRAISHLRTVLEWLNHYENLKKYEIDHKKSSGSYLWTFTFTDAKMFKLWLTLSDSDRKKTGIMTKKTPGGSLVLPPGIEVKCINPQLTAIREQDTDILHMISSGMNTPEDTLTGESKGTFASVKASRGPMSDRTAHEVAYFDRFYKYDFWGSIFFLKGVISDFPSVFRVEEAIGFDEKQEPVFKRIKKRPEQLIDISYPVSEVIDLEARVRALLGVKHGPISESLGIPNSEVARKIGIGGYGRRRLRKAVEDKKYPKLIYELGVDAGLQSEAKQEVVEGEPGKKE